MSQAIKDGKGRGFEAEVNSEQELVTRAIAEPELEHASSRGEAYIWHSAAQDIDSTDTMLFIKNTGSTPLILDRMDVIGSNVACTWTIHLGSDTTTPASVPSVIVAVNLNRIFSSKIPEAEARTDETAVADGDIVRTFHTAATVQAPTIDLTGFILGQGHYIQINQETESTSGSVAIIGHFEDPS